MWFLPISILVGTTILAIPLSKYLAWIMNGKYRGPGILRFFEKKLDSGPQNWKQYTASMLIFNTALFVFGFAVLAMQRENMPLNDLHRGALAPTTIFHSVISFMTNTDLQHYSGDQVFSNFSQIFFGLSNFFLSASIGFCGLTVIIRAFRSDPHVGNFFFDMWRQDHADAELQDVPGFVRFIHNSARSLTIDRLWTLDPGRGNGSVMLRKLCELADDYGVELTLKCKPFGRKPHPMPCDQLVVWYQRYGFVGNRRGMVRDPLYNEYSELPPPSPDGGL